MPCHPDRVHALPMGYQFGDAGRPMNQPTIRLDAEALSEIQRADQPLPLDEQ